MASKMGKRNHPHQRVLAVAAHPDDVGFLMAGALALLHQKGHQIFIATIGTGDMGSQELRNQEIASLRYQEAGESAKILNAPYYCLGESDLHFVFDNPTRFKTVELIRQIQPDIVLTHSPQDYMKDHEITADLLWDACFNASVPNYITNQPNPAKPTTKSLHLYYGDAIEGMNRFGERITPQFYIDISSVIEIKTQMLSAHESQRSWLQEQHSMDQYIENMLQWSRIRGEEISVAYAEGFTQHKGHPFPQDNCLIDLISL
jgi:LmbE family N-acetylglucosaminyl deacetylase